MKIRSEMANEFNFICHLQLGIAAAAWEYNEYDIAILRLY